MDLQQLTEKIGFDSKSFMCGETTEEDEFIRIFYPDYMEIQDVPTKPRPVINTLEDLERMVRNHQKNVNADLKLLRAKIKELKNDSVS